MGRWDVRFHVDATLARVCEASARPELIPAWQQGVARVEDKPTLAGHVTVSNERFRALVEQGVRAST